MTHPLDDIDDQVTFSTTQLRAMRDEMQRFLLEYRFGMQEIETKVAILRDEFQYMHDYNPIEHVSSRVKSPDSLVEKVVRKGIEPDFASIRAAITDIAGVRITCSFITDAYRLFDLLTAQDDVTVLAVKDYIAEPKANGYKSLHAIVEVPVFLSTRPRRGARRGAVPHDRDGLLGEPRAQDLLQVRPPGSGGLLVEPEGCRRHGRRARRAHGAPPPRTARSVAGPARMVAV